MRFDGPKREEIPALRLLWRDAFGDPDSFLDIFFASAFSEHRARCAFVDGNLAGALYWFDCQCGGARLAYVYAVATAKSYRGQGVCRALMEDTHALLRELGYVGAVLVPGDGGLFEMYRKMGYETCGFLRHFSCDAEAGDVSLTEIDRDEFATLRRQYLPKCGIAQEQENLAFLEKQASFYKGEDFLLVCRKEGEILHGIELLGKVDKASRIVYAMGCKRGRFRTVGDSTETPFAMYRSFRNHPMPTYFGLAFD